MRPDPDPFQLSPDERRREVAAILAAGLRCLRDRSALPSEPLEAAETTLEPVPDNSLTGQDG
jgi:hypothetical protein